MQGGNLVSMVLVPLACGNSPSSGILGLLFCMWCCCCCCADAVAVVVQQYLLSNMERGVQGAVVQAHIGLVTLNCLWLPALTALLNKRIPLPLLAVQVAVKILNVDDEDVLEAVIKEVALSACFR